MERGKKINNITLGIFIFTGVVILFFFIYFAGKFSFLMGGGYGLNIQYDFLDNLQSGAKLRISGGPAIGYVDNIIFEKGKLIAKVLINGEYKLNRGAKFYIYSSSLVGQKYINVSGYDPTSTDFYTNNEDIVGVSPLGFARTIELAGMAVSGLISTNNTDMVNKFRETFENIVDLVAGLNRVVQENEGDIRQSIHSLDLALKNSSEVMSRVNNTMYNIESFSKKINSSMSSLTPEEVGNIVTNLNALSFQLKNLSEDINKLSYDKTTPLGMLRDKETRTRLDVTLKNFEIFSQKISSNPSALIFGAK